MGIYRKWVWQFVPLVHFAKWANYVLGNAAGNLQKSSSSCRTVHKLSNEVVSTVARGDEEEEEEEVGEEGTK